MSTYYYLRGLWG